MALPVVVINVIFLILGGSSFRLLGSAVFDCYIYLLMRFAEDEVCVNRKLAMLK